MRRIGRIANRLDVEAHAQKIEAEGYTIIPDAITAEQALRAIQAMEDVYERERCFPITLRATF